MKKITLLMVIVFTITAQAQNKLLSSIDEYYNGSTWVNNSGSNYEYDSNNNLISQTDLKWEFGTWKNSEKMLYTYNSSNKVTELIYQKWNSTTNQFENDSKDIYTYTDGKVTELLFLIAVNSQWVNDEKFILGYNSNNLLVSGSGNSWNGTAWVEKDRESYTYNGSNQLIGDFGETNVFSVWVNDFKGVYGYTNNKITSFINEEWNQGAWSQDESTQFQFDVNGNRASKISQYSANSRFKDEYIYDTSSQISSFAHPFKDKTGFDYLFESFPYANKVLGENQYSYDFGASTYKISSRTTYNYNSAISLSVDQPEIVKSVITVSPNPTSSVLNINSSNASIDKVIVSDITGRTVLQDESTAINVEKLAAGLYIVEAYSGSEKFTAKFVKK